MERSKRAIIEQAGRVVVKLGSRVLSHSDGRPNLKRIEAIVEDVVALRRRGREVLLVSSGAIGAGMGVLGIKRRPTLLPQLQMCAAVGQAQLMSIYERLFQAANCRMGQVLLTHADLRERSRHLNARNTILALLREGVVPVLNENDAVAVDDIRFGDNDILAALASILVEADLLVLMSTVNGLRRSSGGGRTARVPYLAGVTQSELALAGGKGSEISTGGMASKLQAARMAAELGASVVICDGRMQRILERVLAGEDVGTLIRSEENIEGPSAISRKKRWIAFFHRSIGSLIIDDGARRALIEGGKSLLPIGIVAVEGRFGVGASVKVKDSEGRLVARGLVEYSSEQIERIKGRRTSEIEGVLGAKEYDEVIHRDNLVILKPSQEGVL